MSQTRKKKKKRRKGRKASPKIRVDSQTLSSQDDDLSQVEFHRYGLVLVPDPADKWPGVAYILKNRPHEAEHSFCSCSAAKKPACRHILKLADLYRLLSKTLRWKTPDQVFRSSVWYRLASVLGDGCRETPQSVQLQFVTQNSGRVLQVVASDGKEMLSHLSQNADLYRFVERFGQAPAENSVPHRASLLDKLSRMTLSIDLHNILWGVKLELFSCA